MSTLTEPKAVTGRAVTDHRRETHDPFGSRNNGLMCFKCGREFLPMETVWRVRIGIGHHHLTGAWQSRIETFCESCTPKRGSGFEAGGCQTCHRLVMNRAIWARSRRHVFCCQSCERAFYAKRQRAKRLIARQKMCPICRKPFVCARRDATTCTGGCRQRAYRIRRQGKALSIKELVCAT